MDGPAQVARLALLGVADGFHLELDLRDEGEDHTDTRRIRFEDVSEVALRGDWNDWIERGVYKLVAANVSERQLENVRYLVHDQGDAFLSLGCRRIQHVDVVSAILSATATPPYRGGAPMELEALALGDSLPLTTARVRKVVMARRAGALDLDVTFYDAEQGPPGDWVLRFIDVREGRFESRPGMGIGYTQHHYLNVRRHPAGAGEEARFRLFEGEQDGNLDFTFARLVPVPGSAEASHP